jgi:hypothetical protein
MNENIITVEQKPIIKYQLLEQISLDVKAKIESLNLDTLEATEETIATVKNTRAELTKDFKILEEQRKLVKEIVLADYNKFEDEYKRLISSQFSEADNKLKTLVYTVEDKILARKVKGIQDYFISKNTYDFVSFEDVGLNIIKSKADKVYQSDIDEYLLKIQNDLKTIEMVSFEERVLAKYQMYKDLNRAISEVNIEVQREDAIAAKKREEAERAKQEVEKKLAGPAITAQPVEIIEPEQPKVEPATDENKIFKCSFKIFATRNQLREIRNYLQERGIKYE